MTPPGETLTFERLKEISTSSMLQARSWVMNDEGKQMANEILYLRAELARLSKTEPEI